MKQSGFTLLEILVGFSILLAGSTALWWGLQRSQNMEQRVLWKEIMHEAFVSQAERYQGRSSEFLHDTTYSIPLVGEHKIQIRVTLLDSTRKQNLFDSLMMNDSKRKAWFARPVEVQMEAWVLPSSNSEWIEDNAMSGEGSEEAETPKVQLFLTVPDYQWF